MKSGDKGFDHSFPQNAKIIEIPFSDIGQVMLVN